jgi:hypothetical protein
MPKCPNCKNPSLVKKWRKEPMGGLQSYEYWKVYYWVCTICGWEGPEIERRRGP